MGGEDVRYDLREILDHSVKLGGLGIPDPWLFVERAYNTSKVPREVLVVSFIEGINFNYVDNKYCIRRSSVDAQKQREYSDKEVITSSRKELM